MGLVLGLLAAAAAAGPVLVAKGDTLETFDVTVDLAAVDRSSPRALAESYAGMLRDLGAVQRRFAERFEAAHLEILRRYCATDIVDAQTRVYATRRPPAPRYRVESATDEKIRVAGARGPIELGVRRDGEAWRLRGLRSLLAAPGAPVEIPAAAAADVSTPSGAVASLHGDMRRLQALARRARSRLHRHGEALARAFLGDEFAPDRPPAPPAIHYVFGTPEELAAGGTRIVVTAQEEVPDRRGVRSAVGQAAFDLRRDAAGGWRIVAEWARPQPREPLVPQKHAFGLFFAR